MNLTLAGLPELALFDSDAERQNAINEISTENTNLKSWDHWLGVLILAAATMTSSFLCKWFLASVDWPTPIEKTIRVVIVVFVFAFVLRWLHRIGVSWTLREKLLAADVPVCRKCGYLLKGLTVSTARCPECGRPFDDTVRRILS